MLCIHKETYKNIKIHHSREKKNIVRHLLKRLRWMPACAGMTDLILVPSLLAGNAYLAALAASTHMQGRALRYAFRARRSERGKNIAASSQNTGALSMKCYYRVLMSHSSAYAHLNLMDIQVLRR